MYIYIYLWVCVNVAQARQFSHIFYHDHILLRNYGHTVAVTPS